jgi:hypothetical protein
MRPTFTMLLGLIISTGVFAQAKGTRTFQFEKKEGSHSARVVFRTRIFARAGHRSARVVQGQTMVDGRPAIGTDGNIPVVEIDSMRFYLDGERDQNPVKVVCGLFRAAFR